MAIANSVFGVTNVAQKIVDTGGRDRRIMIVNPSTNLAAVEVGGAGLVYGQGIPIAPGSDFAFDLSDPDDDLWVVAGVAGPTNVRLLQRS